MPAMDHFLLDPVLFAIHLLRFLPDPNQALVLNSRILRGLLMCCRQWGKSTIMAIKALHEALTVNGTTVLVLCPTKHQAGEFFENVRAFLEILDIRVRGDGHNSCSTRLPNGSRIIGISKRSQLRGYRNVSLLLIDEAAEVDTHAYRIVSPALATAGEEGGKIWMMSTPNGPRGMFWEAWEDREDDWYRLKVTVDDCPRISRKFLARERRILGESLYRQEYMCEIIDPPDCFLNREDVAGAFRADIPPLYR
ncbi:MAG: phage terminase large subunit [Bryobacteraceae bacterium]|nr:phage terminase large subunit [Bryobacteraceae bacterium]